MKNLHLATLEFLVLAIKAKQFELASAAGSSAWVKRSAEFENLKRRLHLEFYYSLDVHEGADDKPPEA
ncbi:MAG TPA: hypothetical protein VF593_06060 [Chthoniobacteraceae bacterium]|jgi:hypothetical protein